MKSLHSSIVILAMIMALGLSACSQSTPVTPTDLPTTANVGSSEGWLGLYQVSINPDLSYEIAPVRSTTAVGDFFFDLDLGLYLRGAFCPLGDCFNITAIGTTSDVPPKITMDISVRHPFGQYNSSLPLSGLNRADLDVFDPKVVILTEGNDANPLAGGLVDTGLTLPGAASTLQANFGFVYDNDPVNEPLFYGQPTDARLTDSTGTPVDPVNNPAEIFIFTPPDEFPNADMHPYKRVFDGTNADGGTNNPTTGDNRMSQGEAADTAHFVLNVSAGSPTVSFIMGVSSAYGQSAVGRDNRTPDKVKYFPNAFRTPGATDIQVDVTDGTIGSADATVEISIVDPQAGAAVTANYTEYSGQNDGGMQIPPTDKSGTVTFTDMNIETVIISIPDLSDTGGNFPRTFTQIQASSGNGTVANPWVFNFAVDESGEVAGTYDGYILVVDDVYDNDSNSAVYESQAFVVKYFTVTFN